LHLTSCEVLPFRHGFRARAHLAELDADLRRRGLLRDRLAAALGAMDSQDRDGLGRPPVDDAELLMKVIETMTMFDGYVHGYRTEENTRLHDQAIDLSAASLAAAKKRTRDAGLPYIAFAQADVYALPRPDGPLAAATFDHVFVCFLLEHLPRPVEALRRLAARTEPSATRSSRPPRASDHHHRRAVAILAPSASASNLAATIFGWISGT
jgi:SAM-dependent methyltransferase